MNEDSNEDAPIRLTQYSHGAGCGCKLSPAVLDRILKSNESFADDRLLVGNDARDDAAAYLLGDDADDALVALSTTDFFMPIVDDPYMFGRIASANAISDIYAMGGKPIMALAILGWPVDKIAPEVAGEVIRGSRAICKEAGFALAGGHSIDSPEPIFGLAVSGVVEKKHLKRNHSGKKGDLLLLTKAIGVGILTTALKKGLLKEEDEGVAAASMMKLNDVGAKMAHIEGVNALTDVTGFGLLGHLVEVCQGSKLSAQVELSKIQLLTNLDFYLDKGTLPGGTGRNWESYGHHISELSDRARTLLADPQTSGGLLLAVAPDALSEVQKVLTAAGLEGFCEPIGELQEREEGSVVVRIQE
ncbi:MAG: selenide, water dikinase SelD [Deltaproteobacteria bacterium]|nr:selenide, water dikinase SelD [Deltaproteobacteria bacterium]